MSNRFVVFEAFVNEADLTEMREVASFRVKGDALYFMRNNNLYGDDALELIELYRDGTLGLIEVPDMLQSLLDLIYENGIENLSMLHKYVSDQGEYYGIDSVEEMYDVIESHTGIIELAFDGERQERKRQMDGNTTY